MYAAKSLFSQILWRLGDVDDARQLYEQVEELKLVSTRSSGWKTKATLEPESMVRRVDPVNRLRGRSCSALWNCRK